MTADPATLWHATARPLPDFSALTGPVEADLLVIGGGFAGLSTALHAAEAGLSVVLVEAHRIAWGASGRNAGFVVPNFAKVDPDDIRAAHGAAGDRLVAMAAGSGDLVFDLIRRHAIDCDAQQTGWIQPAHAGAALAKAQSRVRQWTANGRPVELLDANCVTALTGVSGWCGGWIDWSGGVLNPVGYARGLAAAASGAGARLHEQSPVIGLQRQGPDWLATTPRGDVKARRVILATNAYVGRLWPRLAQSFFPLRVFQVATEPLSLSVRTRLLPGGQAVSDSRRNLFSFRFDAQNRLISGGMHVLSLGVDARVPRAIHRRLARFLDLPDLPPLAFSWSGMASVMPDFLPRLVELGPNLIAGFACNGRGIALSTAMGRELAGWAAGQDIASLAIPVRSATRIPFHGLARLAPNAMLPVSIVRDRIEARSRACGSTAP
jgi:glycine/D-amino acid oxidase-like deaminating enzyme